MDFKQREVMNVESYEKITALARVVSSMKDAFLPNREDKDRIVRLSAYLLTKELEKIEKESR